MDKTVSKIDASQTYSVRHKVLRPGKPIQSAYFSEDALLSSHHFGFESFDEIVGVLSLFDTRNDLLDAKLQYQLRGMAVLPEFQRQNIGNRLLDFAEEYLRKLQIDLIWCNARESAVTFYSARGYEKVGDVFTISDIGNHYIMYKKLQ